MSRYQAYLRGLREEIDQWSQHVDLEQNPWWEIIQELPNYFEGLANLLDEEELSSEVRKIVCRVVKYIESPLDLYPEFIYGPEGFIEDLLLVSLLCEKYQGHEDYHLFQKHHLEFEDELLQMALELGEEQLDNNIMEKLEILLDADALAGDASNTAPPKRLESDSKENTIVFAGPGTGKTYTLEKKVEALIVEEGIPPHQILLTTFTNKASDELRIRVRESLVAKGVTHVDQVLQQLTICTIHSFCFSLISAFHHNLFFLKGNFSPMDDTKRMLFLFKHGMDRLGLKKIYNQWKGETSERNRKEKNYYQPVDYFHFYSYVGNIYDFISEEALSGESSSLRQRYIEVINELHENLNSVEEKVISTYPNYWSFLQDQGFIDNSMILSYASALLEDEQILTKVQNQYRQILVDEYQDTNRLQDKIFRKITGENGNIFAVGDEDQSIYAFRGADVRNALKFDERYPRAQARTLEENRRSTEEIVQAGQELIKNNETHNKEKILFTQNPKGTPPWILKSEDPKELPAELADSLKHLKEKGIIEKWSDVALLFRSSKRISAYKEAMSTQGIPYTHFGNKGFFKQPIPKAFQKIFKMVAGIDKITKQARSHMHFFKAINVMEKEQANEFVSRWQESFKSDEYKSLLDMYYKILNDTAAIEHPDLLATLGRFSSILADAEAEIRNKDLKKRTDWFISYTEAADGLEGPSESVDESVNIMTIHKSKGLEFPFVVIPEFMEGDMPALWAEDFSAKLRYELAEIKPWLDQIEEERRCLYVAMTRAQKHLLFATVKGQESRYLDEFHWQEVPKETKPIPSDFIRKKGEQSRIHASHSMVFNYEFCPKRYQLESHYGFAGHATPQLTAGTSLHKSLEIFHRLVQEGEIINDARLRRIMEKSFVSPNKAEDAKKQFEKLYQIFFDYVQNFDRDSTKIVDMERPFYIVEGPGVLTGKIDLIQEKENKMEIVEFKFNKNEHPNMRDYAKKQLNHYRLAYPSEEPTLKVHYLKENEIQSVEAQKETGVRETIGSTFELIQNEEFSPQAKTSKCRICPVRAACPHHSLNKKDEAA